MFINESKEG